jgi:ABC-type cobalamin/Fe3+-siderophores transport system ATPase subunit
VTDLTAVDVTVTLDRTQVVKAVSCTVKGGGWLALIGPNGAGKSTLIRAMAGLVPYGGTITLDAVDAKTMKGKERAKTLAYVPQEPTLPPDLTVEQYVMLGRTPHLGYLATPGRHDRERVGAAMARLDVTKFAKRPLARLSGGERQRAVLARALAGDPRALLLDEPTSMLDVGHEQQVLELVDADRGVHAARPDGGRPVRGYARHAGRRPGRSLGNTADRAHRPVDRVRLRGAGKRHHRQRRPPGGRPGAEAYTGSPRPALILKG